MFRLSGKRLFLALFAVLALATLVASPASAQNVPNTLELTAFGGGAFGNRLYRGSQTNVDVSTAGAFGARLGYNVTRAFEIEASWNHASANLDAHEHFFTGSRAKLGTIKQDVIEGNALWHWGNRRASGYVAFGLGAMLFNPDIPGVNFSDSTHFTTSIGMGGKFSLTPRVAIRVDGRFRGTNLTDHSRRSGVWCDDSGSCFSYFSNWYNSGELTGGLLFRF